MVINRTAIQIVYQGNVSATSLDTKTSPIIPSGKKWQISRVIFADKNIGDNISGGFTVEFGEGTTWEYVAAAYLTGNTHDLSLNKIYTGDGAKYFRMRRQNNSSSAKPMLLLVEGFKREGE